MSNRVEGRFIEPIPHNSLSGIQGGAVDQNDASIVTEAYHLTEEELEQVLAILPSGSGGGGTGGSTGGTGEGEGNGVVHNSLAEIQGGLKNGSNKTTEAYHLTGAEYQTAQAILLRYNEIMAKLDAID